MNIWSTFRFVPPIAPEAMAWATLSFATYLAAVEMRPTAFGQALDPLVLALAAQMVLLITKNVTSDRFAAFVRTSPGGVSFWSVLFWSITILGGIGVFVVTASAAVAAKVFILYQVGHALNLAWVAMFSHKRFAQIIGTWTQLKQNAQTAAMLESAGLLVSAMTLFTVWHFAGALAFAAMMSFGVLVLRLFTNWVVVLYLLDAQQRTYDE